MAYVESIDDTQDLATKALTFLGRQNLALIPQNYTVAYGFFTGKRPALNSEIKKMIAVGGVGPSEMVALYDAYFGLEAESVMLRSAREMVEGIIANLRQSVAAAGEDAAGYGEILQDFLGQAAAGRGGPEDLAQATKVILAETEKMESRHSDLRWQFAETCEEVTQLGRNLDKMHLAADTDSLTGVANRQHFETRCREMLDQAAVNGAPISVLMADIDHLESVNDNHGRQVGDHVLRLVSVAISQAVRGGDFVARHGGEEFAVLLSQTGLDGALSVAENIRHAIASKRLTRKSTGEELGVITLSLGAAHYRDGECADGLIRRAQEGLSRAKRRGCNRVETVEPVVGAGRLASVAG